MKDSSLIRKLQNLTRISRQNQLIRPRRRQRTDTGLSRQQIRQRSGLVIVKTQCKKCVGRNLYPHRLFAFIEIHDNQYDLVTVFAHKGILAIRIEIRIPRVGIHQVEESPLSNGLLRFRHVQYPGILLTQFTLLVRQTGAIELPVVDPFAQALHAPVIEYRRTPVR